MKAVQFEEYGNPADVLSCVELPEPGAPTGAEIIVRMEAAPINPADLLMIAGEYAEQPNLPHVAGLEGAGRIEAVGAGVSGFSEGALVVPIPGSSWQQRMRLKATDVIPLPEGIDPEQAAMLKVNPATAELLLSDVLKLESGDWVAQNAANSAVGRLLVQLAGERGVHTLNIVRRESAVRSLEDLGADAVLVDEGGDPAVLAQRAAEVTGGASIRLGIDAIGGAATDSLAGILADGGVVANYGLLSGESCNIHPRNLIYRGVTLRGFWLSEWFQRARPGQVPTLYKRLVSILAEGKLHVPVAARYPLAQVKEAVEHAGRGGRDGKVLLTC